MHNADGKNLELISWSIYFNLRSESKIFVLDQNLRLESKIRILSINLRYKSIDQGIIIFWSKILGEDIGLRFKSEIYCI